MKRTVLFLFVLTVGLALGGCALTSEETGTVYGYVRLAGTATPLAGAIVTISGDWTQSESDGYYELSGVRQGERIVRAELSGYDLYQGFADVEEYTRHDIDMTVYVGTAQVSGTVEHASLGPVEGAVVTLYGKTDTTDAEGAYSFGGIPQTQWDLEVTADGYRSFTAPLPINDDVVVYDVELKKLKSAEFGALADAYVSETQPTANYGTGPNINLFDNGFLHWRFFIYFDIDIEPTADVVSATMRLYNTADGAGQAEERPILVARVAEDWFEAEVAWEDSTLTTGASIASGEYEAPWYAIDISDFVADWIEDGYPNQGILVDTSEDPTASRFEFASREYAEADKRPVLVLDYAW